MTAMLLASVPALAAGPSLRLKHVRTAANQPERIQVFVSTKVPLGAYTFQLSFDAAALQLIDIKGGTGEFVSAPFSDPQKFVSGVVRFSAFQPMQMEGPMGLCHVATLSFQPRSARATTRVRVEAVTLADTLGSTYRTAAVRKTLRIRTRR